jgi:hypothetical protein
VKRGVKILLVVTAIGVGLVGALGIVGVWWWHENRDRLRAEGEAMKAAGRAFGSHRDSAACLSESLARLDQKSGILDEARTKVFLESCLATAGRDPSLCAGVPAESEIMASVRWRMAECSRHEQANDQRCARLLSAIQEVCHGR